MTKLAVNIKKLGDEKYLLHCQEFAIILKEDKANEPALPFRRPCMDSCLAQNDGGRLLSRFNARPRLPTK